MTPLASAPRLLVVEDDTDLLALISETLKEGGYNVTPATSLPDALRALENHLFQLVLTDLFREPNQSHPIQSIQPLLAQAAPIPVGVMTAWQVAEDDPDLANLAFLLRKPFELDDLLGKVDAELYPTIRSLRRHTLVEQFFLAINARDWPLLARLCTPDVKMSPPGNVTPVRIGLPGYLGYLEQRISRLPGYTLEEAQVVPRQNGIAARYVVRWQDSYGAEHWAAGSMFFHFRNGRIAQIEGARKPLRSARCAEGMRRILAERRRFLVICKEYGQQRCRRHIIAIQRTRKVHQWQII